MKTWILTGLAAVLLLAFALFYLRDTRVPELTLTPDSGPVSPARPPVLEVTDSGAGLRHLSVTARQGDASLAVLAKDFAPGTQQSREELHLPEKGLRDGPLELRVRAVDHAVFHFGAGNATEKTFAFDYDGKAPLISVLSSAHNLHQGGAGLIVYRLSEEAQKTGVALGDLFFPGYRQENGAYACLFSYPWFLVPGEAAPQLVAVDRAGNERKASFSFHVNPRSLPQVNLNISQSFLDSKMPQFQSRYPEAKDLLDVYLKVNRDLRKENDEQILDIAGQSASRPLWQGAFLRQPKAADREPFGARRSYFFAGSKIDEQVHLGVDLASLAQAPVPAANAGTVAFAGDLGIYGQCIILDHGLGLQSLYGHLSRIAVNVGETVTKGQIIGNTGATGLAGGDHLHFGMLVAGLPVTPVEWWDGDWMANNIDGKLELGAPEPPPAGGKPGNGKIWTGDGKP